MGRLGIGNLLLEPEIHRDFISGFITKLPRDDFVLTRLVYQGVRKIQDEYGQWENEAIPLYFEGFFYLKRELIYEAFNNAFERVENRGRYSNKDAQKKIYIYNPPKFTLTRIYGHLRWPFFSPCGYGKVWS